MLKVTHMQKVSDDYWCALSIGNEYVPADDARPCEDPLLLSADFFTHKGVGEWRKQFRVSCGRTGCGASGHAETREGAECAALQELGYRAAHANMTLKERLWSAIADGVKRHGISPRYGWETDGDGAKAT